MINAMNLLLGARASSDLIRTGAKEARVEGLFRLPQDHEVAQVLEGAGIPFESEIIIKRSLTREGRNRIFINDSMVTLNVLSRIGALLISISGQHEHQLLLKPERHVFVLDRFAGLTDARQDLEKKIKEYQKVKEKIRKLESDLARAKERQELARFQVQEIEAARIRPGEDEELAEEKRRLEHAEDLLRVVGEGYKVLYEEENAAFSLVSQCLKQLEKAVDIDPRLKEAFDMLEEARVRIEDSAFFLRDFRDRIESDPVRLEQLLDRIHVLNELKRKYGPSLSDVLAFKEKQSLLVDEVGDRKRELEKLKAESDVLEKEIIQQASILSQKRKQAAGRLTNAVENELMDLHMKGTRFDIQFLSPEKPEIGHVGPTGMDEIQFMISPNVGEELRPLAKIASGGELSRIMLALKSILAREASVETVIFDEVDSGISGSTAEMVGEKLMALAKYHQILCITHLPQIASKGRDHFLVEKRVAGGRTEAMIRKLEHEQRVQEIARMLGGKRITEKALSHAKEMLG